MPVSKRFRSTFSTVPYKGNLNKSVEIVLATTNPDHHMNLMINGGDATTMLPGDAIKLRDALLKAYPLPVEPAKAEPTPAKFKVGDHVRMTKPVSGRLTYVSGKVVADRGAGNDVFGSGRYSVEFPAPFRGHGLNGRTWDCPEDSLALSQAADEAGRYIVALKVGANYEPNKKPFVHGTRTEAEAEAQRLAKLHGGTFHVLRATFEATRDVPVMPPVKTAKL